MFASHWLEKIFKVQITLGTEVQAKAGFSNQGYHGPDPVNTVQVQQNVQPVYASVLYTNNETVLHGEQDTGSFLVEGRGWIRATTCLAKSPFMLRSLVSAPLATAILFAIKVF